MKKTVRKSKKAVANNTDTKSAVVDPICFRYEFSDEEGRPEGGDIFQYTSLEDLKKFMSEVIDVAQNDGVSVSLTIGEGKAFFNFLKNNGLSQKEIESEMVDLSVDPLSEDEKQPLPKSSKTKKKNKKN